jgi:hypothetical protein
LLRFEKRGEKKRDYITDPLSVSFLVYIFRFTFYLHNYADFTQNDKCVIICGSVPKTYSFLVCSPVVQGSACKKKQG